MADQAEKDTVISNPAGLMEGSPCVHSGEFQEKATLFRNFRQLNAPRLKPRTQRLCRVGCIGHQLSFTCENMHDIFPPVTAKEAKNANFSTKASAIGIRPYGLCGGKLGTFLKSSSLLGSSFFLASTG